MNPAVSGSLTRGIRFLQDCIKGGAEEWGEGGLASLGALKINGSEGWGRGAVLVSASTVRPALHLSCYPSQKQAKQSDHQERLRGVLVLVRGSGRGSPAP